MRNASLCHRIALRLADAPIPPSSGVVCNEVFHAGAERTSLELHLALDHRVSLSGVSVLMEASAYAEFIGLTCGRDREVFLQVAAVACGIRTACMISFARVESQALVGAVAKLERRLCMPPSTLFVATLQGCCYVANRSVLFTLPSLPRCFVIFDAVDRRSEPRWADSDEHAALVMQLTNATHHLGKAAAAGVTGAQAGHHVPQLVNMDDLCSGSVAMPIFSGWLLGYPAIYVARSQDDAERASRQLSYSTLCFHDAKICLQLDGFQHEVGELIRFSVPKALTGATPWQACRRAWQAAVVSAVKAAQEAGLPWSNASFEVHDISVPKVVL
jgi:hypothetical protein